MHRRFFGLWLMIGTVAVGAGVLGVSAVPRSTGQPVLIHPAYVDFRSTQYAFQPAEVQSSALVAPVGAIVNHHLLAASFIRDTLNKIRPSSIRHIILISPNHFLAGQTAIQTANVDFATPYGVVHINHATASTLTTSGVVRAENDTFVGEHGVYNILPYIARQLPWATVTPIIIKYGTPERMLVQLRSLLDAQLLPGTLVLGSFDFSHYLTSAQADAQDAMTLRSITSIGADTIDPLYVDSPEGLRLTLDLMHDAGARRFELVRHSNSAKLAGNLTLAQTTSYVTGLFWR